MSENSSIEWTDHTFNPWWGCAKVSPGCDNCYAERDAKRFAGDRVLWGLRRDGAERRTFDEGHWTDPLRWNKKARLAGARRRVFCASMADVFDKDGDSVARTKLWYTIKGTEQLDWLLLTKRIGNAERFLPGDWQAFGLPPNVWLGISVVNQEEADRDIPKLLALPARIRFLSCEPMLGPINLDTFLCKHCAEKAGATHDGPLSWVIAGGESGPNARPAHPDWFRSLRDQCAHAGVPFLFKQWGEWAPIYYADAATKHRLLKMVWTKKETTIGGPAERTEATNMLRSGKRIAGRMLDGVQHDGFPQ